MPALRPVQTLRLKSHTPFFFIYIPSEDSPLPTAIFRAIIQQRGKFTAPAAFVLKQPRL